MLQHSLLLKEVSFAEGILANPTTSQAVTGALADLAAVIQFERYGSEGDVPDGRPTIEELDASHAKSVHFSVGVAKDDSIDSLNGIGGLLVQPSQQANASGSPAVSRHRSRLVNASRNGHVVHAAGHA